MATPESPATPEAPAAPEAGRTVLAVVPHAFDEVLACGGTLAAHAAAGARVAVLVLFGDGSGADAARRTAAVEAAAALGIAPPDFAGFPENRSDTVPLLAVVGAVEAAVRALGPDTVHLCHGGNLNLDHATAFRAAVTALRPVPGLGVRGIYAGEVPSSTDWAPPGLGEPFRPTRFVDIAATLERKLAAADCYRCDLRPWPHARSREAIAALARHRGAAVGLEAAEAFMTVREVLRP